MRLVVIESPFAGDVGLNISYAKSAMADSLQRGEAPYASHLLYTRKDILDDEIPHERKKGIKAGFLWGEVAECRVVYLDRGISSGMARGIYEATRLKQEVEFRSLPQWHDATYLDMARSSRIPLDLREKAVDWWTEAWHMNPGEVTLYQFLGMTSEQYQRWVSEPDYLTVLLEGG